MPTTRTVLSLWSAVSGACQSRWLTLKYQLYRGCLRNPPSRRRFRQAPPELSAAQRDVVGGLRERGLAMARFPDLFPDDRDGLWAEASRVVTEFTEGPSVREGVKQYEARYDKAAWKEYIVRLFQDHQSVPAGHPLLRLALHPHLLDTVNTYLGLWAKLLAVNLWYTIPIDRERARSASQNWHRDPEDRALVKVFLYFSEVDEGAGPMQYIPGSRPGGPYGHLWPPASGQKGYDGYPPQAAVDAAVPPSERVTCTAPAGTLTFCDTSGFHRGGFATKRPRVLAVFTYVTPASLYERLFRVDGVPPEAGRSEAARFALS